LIPCDDHVEEILAGILAESEEVLASFRPIAANRLIDVFADDLVSLPSAVGDRLVSLSGDRLLLLAGAHPQTENCTSPTVTGRMARSHSEDLPIRSELW
jgi:hypothetical protein